jgi:hypothetical protein
MTPVRMKIVFRMAGPHNSRVVKATLVFAAIVAFLPLVVRAGLRHLSRRRRSGRSVADQRRMIK